MLRIPGRALGMEIAPHALLDRDMATASHMAEDIAVWLTSRIYVLDELEPWMTRLSRDLPEDVTFTGIFPKQWPNGLALSTICDIGDGEEHSVVFRCVERTAIEAARGGDAIVDHGYPTHVRFLAKALLDANEHHGIGIPDAYSKIVLASHWAQSLDDEGGAIYSGCYSAVFIADNDEVLNVDNYITYPSIGEHREFINDRLTRELSRSLFALRLRDEGVAVEGPVSGSEFGVKLDYVSLRLREDRLTQFQGELHES